MGSYGGRGEPVFLKEDSAAGKQLSQLEALLERTGEAYREPLERDIRMLRAGIAGERQILFELKSSHLPMYVLHDLFIRDGELSAQIDFVVVTPKITFFLECKNLFGDIHIGADGSFTRTLRYEGKTVQEGIYSPITQNERHMELVKVWNAKRMGVFKRAIYLKSFHHLNRFVVVLSNPKSVLDAADAPEDIRRQVIRADQLVRYIKESNQQRWQSPLSKKDMERLARRILEWHTDEPHDYTWKYREAVLEKAQKLPPVGNRKSEPAVNTEGPKCPRCGSRLIKKTGRFGPFWGCSGYPSCGYTEKIWKRPEA